jgi:hypothetical protein
LRAQKIAIFTLFFLASSTIAFGQIIPGGEVVFSIEEEFAPGNNGPNSLAGAGVTHGDLLSETGAVLATNAELVAVFFGGLPCAVPRDFGLDAVDVISTTADTITPWTNIMAFFSTEESFYDMYGNYISAGDLLTTTGIVIRNWALLGSFGPPQPPPSYHVNPYPEEYDYGLDAVDVRGVTAHEVVQRKPAVDIYIIDAFYQFFDDTEDVYFSFEEYYLEEGENYFFAQAGAIPFGTEIQENDILSAAWGFIVETGSRPPNPPLMIPGVGPYMLRGFDVGGPNAWAQDGLHRAFGADAVDIPMDYSYEDETFETGPIMWDIPDSTMLFSVCIPLPDYLLAGARANISDGDVLADLGAPSYIDHPTLVANFGGVLPPDWDAGLDALDVIAAEFYEVQTEDCLIICPGSDIVHEVWIYDGTGAPAQGIPANDIWLDFSGCDVYTMLCPCPEELFWPIVYADGPTDINGRTTFTVDGGGCCDDTGPGVPLYIRGLESYRFTGVKSPDMNADCAVTSVDSALFFDCMQLNGYCCDFDCNGSVDISDFIYWVNHYGHICPATGANNVEVDEAGNWLGRSVPNPLSRDTEIQFSLEREGYAKVSVHDISGRLVKVLEEGMLLPGAHTLIWDGTDQSGRPVSSGVYFYKLQSSDFKSSKKMILMR